MEKVQRQLYQCSCARVRNREVVCSKGHRLLGNNNRINITAIKRGAPLVFKACQNCTDFDYMGEPVKAEDRGW